MSMSGDYQRIADHLFGSAIIYAAQERPSAPGQLRWTGCAGAWSLWGWNKVK